LIFRVHERDWQNFVRVLVSGIQEAFDVDACVNSGPDPTVSPDAILEGIRAWWLEDHDISPTIHSGQY
jgi:hypothetical protein